MELNQAEVEKLRSSFAMVGKKLNEKLNHIELDACMKLAGYKMTEDEQKALLCQVDPEGQNQFDFERLTSMAKEIKRQQVEGRDEKRKKAVAACKKFDKAGSGLLNNIDFILALSSENIRLTTEQKNAALTDDVTSLARGIKYEEFIEKHIQ